MAKYADPDFNAWYQEYPLKKGKAAAYKAWLKADRPPIETMLSILREQKLKERQWQNKQFIPHPSTYLNQERWDDEITESTPTETHSDRHQTALRRYTETRCFDGVSVDALAGIVW